MGRWLVTLLLALTVTFTHSCLYNSTVGQRLEPLALDLWFNLRGKTAPPPELMIVALDEDSYQELDLAFDQAWPRAVHVRLLERLAKAGARRVVFDILFAGETSDTSADHGLAQALATVPTVIGADSGASVGSFQIEQVLMPAEEFQKQVEQVALVGLPEDGGKVRRFKVERPDWIRQMPTLAEAGAGIKVARDRLPAKQDFIKYYGPAGAIPTYSYYEVLDPELVSDQELQDRIVYVGLLLRTGLGPVQKDSYLTPFWKQGRIFGVEIHATAAANLLESSWIKRLPSQQELILLGIVTFLLAGAMICLRPQWGAFLLIAFILSWAVMGFSLFLRGIFVPGVTLVVVLLPSIYLMSTLYFYIVSQRVMRHTRRAFEMYLSPPMAREVAKDPKALALGGESIVATALFTDIVGFTSIAEGLAPDETARMLNAYFSEVMGVIIDNDGTLIKFIGDSVFAIWGAPLPLFNHAGLAVQTAVAIQERVRKFNSSRRFPVLDTKIGINTGPMLVGNLGSSRRFDYTAIGDSVNLAARVEGLNKHFGSKILITEGTKQELLVDVRTCMMGAVVVAGKADIVNIHMVCDESLSEQRLEIWSQALAAFADRNWGRAKTLFMDVQTSEVVLQKAAILYLNEIERYRNTPPVPEWHGELIWSVK